MPDNGLQRAVDEFRAATTLLTRIPVGAPSVPTTGAAAFPLIGAGLGVAAALALWILPARDGLLAAPLALAILVFLNGALHLDGLADSIDALSAATPDAAERARKDPRVGAAGAAALILVLAADVASLVLLAGSGRLLAGLCLISGVAAARAGVVLVAPALPRRQSGFGAWFTAGTDRTRAVIALAACAAIAAALSLLAGNLIPLATAAAGVAVAAGVAAGLARRQGGATGDAFGAAIELGFAASLCVAAVLRP